MTVSQSINPLEFPNLHSALVEVEEMVEDFRPVRQDPARLTERIVNVFHRVASVNHQPQTPARPKF